MRLMQVLFVENDDSFSWNVVDALPFSREQIRIVSGSDQAGLASALAEAEAVVIGPGPKDPVRAGLVDLTRTVAAHGLPLLGICLGHQAIGVAFGAQLDRTTPHHGKRSQVEWRGSRFIPDGSHMAMRYHSLALTTVPQPLRCSARTADDVVMAIEHVTLPILGLQFHPDSFGTPNGRQILRAFFEAIQ